MKQPTDLPIPPNPTTHACHMDRHGDCKGYGFNGLKALLEKRKVSCSCRCHHG